MLSAFWLIGWPALIIADRALETRFFSSGIRMEEPAFFLTYIFAFAMMLWGDFRMWRPRTRIAELSEGDRLRLRNITAAYNTVAKTVNDNTETLDRRLGAVVAKVDRQQKIDGDFKLAAANAITAFDAWTSNVPELPSTRHAFERAIHRLRQEVQRTN